MKENVATHQQEVIKKWLGTGSINIFGPQYAGKDTQGNKLVEMLDAAPLIGGGDILRSSVIPEHVKDIMNQGQLIPTKDYIEIVLPYLAQPAFANKPLVLSAVGRWHGEEKGVLQATTESNHPLKAVVYMKLAEEVIWSRWVANNSRNGGLRQDEAKHALEMRLEEFRQKTLPVIDFYCELGLLIEIDGDQTPEKVFGDILNALYKKAKTKS